MDGKHLVAAVRHAATLHNTTWEQLVPNRHEINFSAEQAEEDAFQDMAEAKARLREHICETYGISIRELSNLAVV